MKRLMYKSLGFYLNSLTRIAPKKGGKLGFNFVKENSLDLADH
ncbi:hypothetical protein [Cyclobacterium sp.]|nr:hypothetical protein [Cyclobacterium sp.]